VSNGKSALLRRSRAVVALPFVLAWLAVTAAPLFLWPAFAASEAVRTNPRSTVPLPPARPPAPAQGSMTKDTHPAEATPAVPKETTTAVQDLQPRVLPQASRARMHACGLEWQKMKQSGAAADKTWFDFARICLTK
jgi:hypothetical protein